MIQISGPIDENWQIILPNDVRRALGLTAPGYISFVVQDDGTVELRSVNPDLAAILGSPEPLSNASPDFDRRKRGRPRH